MPKPRLLDLFCKAGGATRGYQEAGFHVTGVDHEPQPNYVGDAFILADALEVPLEGYDAIHASPPCEFYSVTCRHWGTWQNHPDLIPPTRERLEQARVPWVIENVPGPWTPMRPDYVLCGCMVGLPAIRRVRWFETSWHGFAFAPSHDHRIPAITIAGHGMTKHSRQQYGGNLPLAERRAAMGIGWMNRDELAQAIPPAYTRFIGEQLREQLGAVSVL